MQEVVGSIPSGSTNFSLIRRENPEMKTAREMIAGRLAFLDRGRETLAVLLALFDLEIVVLETRLPRR